MKNTLILLALFTFLFSSCNSLTQERKVKNSDTITVLNGRDTKDTIHYSCDSCEKLIPSFSIFQAIIDHATNTAKNSLNNPLSFIPRSIKLSVIPNNSLRYYGSGKKVDSCLLVNVEYKCIGKNAYGIENEVNAKDLIFLVGKKIDDSLMDEIQPGPLEVADIRTGILSRELKLYDDDNESIEILPIAKRPYSLIVTTSQSCVDKGAILTITLDDDTKVTMSNWKDFNCKGMAYFSFSKDELAEIGKHKVKYISFSGDKTIFTAVPLNQSDYLMLYAKIINKII